MHNYFYVQINGFSFIVLLLIFVNIRGKMKRSDLPLRLYTFMLYGTASLLIIDSIAWLVDGQNFWGARTLNQTMQFLYYVLAPTVCYLWVLYADSRIHNDKSHLKKIAKPLSIPLLLSFFLSLGSLFGNVVYYVDEENFYQRGRFFLPMAPICLFYLLYTLIYVVSQHKKLDKKYYIPILMFAAPPVAATIIQVFVYGLSLIWCSVTISALMIFINLQNDQLYKDHLTGLNNRRYLDFFLRDKRTFSDEKQQLAGIMIDLNSFKQINDQHGHNVGDVALDYTGHILQESLRENDLVARYGGDEFIILLKVASFDDLHAAVERIKGNVARFNEQKRLPFDISLSIGYDILKYDNGMTVPEFIEHIDNLMYQDKMDSKEKNPQR